MRFTVQKYESVSGKEDDHQTNEHQDFQELVAKNEGRSANGNTLTIDDDEQQDKKMARPPVVRFNNVQDKSLQEEVSVIFSEPSDDNSISVDMDNVDSTATVRPTADRKQNVMVSNIAQRGRWFAERHQNRLVFKDGTCNVSTKNILQRKQRYLFDIFTTFVDMKWRYNIILFGVAFVGSWFAFALVWWIQAIVHDDYRAVNDTDWPSCVANVYDFPTALLFSVETQHTIGYGSRAIETHCPFAVIVLMLQSCYGVFVQSLMTGLIFAKLSRPKRRAQTMMFSKMAVICMRDNQYCLLFRLGDMRRSHIIGTSIRALLVKNRLTKEGESIPLCQYSLTVETETNFGDNFVFLVWPVTVVHRIIKGSPLWELTAAELFRERFEIIVIFEGIVENTGMTTQFRTSYMPSEILWGHRLEPLVTYCKGNGQYDIDFKRFHDTRLVESMPECSAREFAERSGIVSKSLDQQPQDKEFLANFTAASDCYKTKKNQIPNGIALKKLAFRKKLSKKRVLSSKSVPEPKVCSNSSSVDFADSCHYDGMLNSKVIKHIGEEDSNKNTMSSVKQRR